MRRVMRAPSLRYLVPPLGYDSGHGFVTARHQNEPPHVGKRHLKGFTRVSVPGELGSQAQAEKSSGSEEGADGIGVEIGMGGERSQELFGARTPLHGGPSL
ncbi:MAG: hypothetical protein ACRD1X_18560 [Vicinamibacteria bacterium]